MTRSGSLSYGLFLVALLGSPGCSKREAPGGAGAPDGAAAAPRETIAPLIFPLGLAQVEMTVTEDAHWSKEPGATVAFDETFLLELGMGGGLDGLNVTTVPASGHASHVYQVREKGALRWMRVRFEVQKAEIERLMQVLDENRFLQMAERYDARDVHDGSQWIVHVRSRGLDKYVSASNAFPTPLIAVARFVTERIVDTRPGLREASQPAALGKAYGDHLWRAVRRYAVRALEPGPPDFADAPRLAGLVVPDEPLPEGTRLEAVITDRSDEGRVLAKSGGGNPRFWVFYDEKKVDPWHHYALEVRLTRGGAAVYTSDAMPVLTLDGAHAVEVSLPRP